MVLSEAYRALKPGGKLLLDLNNRERVLKNYRHSTIVERDGNYVLDRMHYDMLTGRNITERITVRDGQIRHMRFFVRFFPYPELATWLRQAGFQQIHAYDQDGQPLDLESRRMIVVADK